MFAIISFRKPNGEYDTVGTNNRIPMSDLKTERGYERRARAFKRACRLELYRDRYEQIAFKTIYIRG